MYSAVGYTSLQTSRCCDSGSRSGYMVSLLAFPFDEMISGGQRPAIRCVLGEGTFEAFMEVHILSSLILTWE